MKVLWSWLLELCDLPTLPTVSEGAKALTRGGLEIETIEHLGAGFSGVVVAEVVGKQPHPDSNKLTLVDVITEKAGAITQVVCGASNVPEPGRRVLWAQVGAKLPNGLTLAPKAVKGIVSPGMLCAEDELGLGSDHAGIIVLPEDDLTPLGAPAQRALGLEDYVLEVAAPANRADVLGHLGIARELCAMLRGQLAMPATDLTEYTVPGTPNVDVAIADVAQCTRYTARIIDGVTIKPSPARIAQRLRNVGVRAINNVVDITNYVMFELGQPLHAFDAATLKTNVVSIGPARDAEAFVTLDNQPRTLVLGDLMIRDGERGIALAGVMGGLDTEVTTGTTRILLESAAFNAKLVRKTARRLTLRSEASLRFERGVDPELAALASARAARLLCEHGGGKVIGELVDAYPGRRPVAAISLRLERLRMLSGIANFDGATACEALRRLGCTVIAATESVYEVTPLSARPDLTREVDLIEEVLRISGYENVPSTLPALRQAPPLVELDRADVVRRALAAAGMSEAITFGFQSVERCNALGVSPTDRRSAPIPLRNPMSLDQAVMRTSLVPNLVAAIARNQSFGRNDVAIFEAGSVFLRRDQGGGDGPIHGLADEPTWVAGVLAGKRAGHIGDGAAWDAFDVKAFALVAIRAIAGALDLTIRATHDVPFLHPGVAGELVHANERIGVFGELHPRMRGALGVTGAAFVFDLDLTRLPVASPTQMTPIPKYPGTSRDVSLLLAAAIPAAVVEATIRAVREPLVDGVRLLEDYRDADKLGAGQKSMLWSIAYRASDRTLTDAEVDKAHEGIVGRLVENLPAVRR